jgi:hypothetical protein
MVRRGRLGAPECDVKKLIVFVLAAVFAAAVFATGQPPVVHPAQATSSATGGNSAGGNAVGGSVGGSDALMISLPGHGSPSYAGAYSVCVRGSGVFWNFYWSWAPDLECIELIARLDRLKATPAPAPQVQILTAPAADCAKPASPRAAAPRPKPKDGCGK